MTGDWSLKGKKIMCLNPEVNRYSVFDIETLRKKLIEIIKVNIGEEVNYADPDDIIKAVNKLFGVFVRC